MAQVINTNSLSLITQNNINKNQSALSTSIERLSSGLRINSAKDDAAGEGFSLPPDSPALHVIQHIRDESHDHAIGGHRKKRAKVKNTSSLETIEGVGPKRRQMLLKYMGGLQGLRNASVEEIAKVPGISQGLAEKIFWSLKH